jgi:branched-chain amino acid transport system ATP-binding protein
MSLVVKDMVSGYGKLEILHGVSITAPSAKITCIIGPNGSGKSTLLKTIIGLVKVWGGAVEFDSTDITASSPNQILKTGLTLIAQSRSVFPQLSVLENLQMGAYVLKDRALVRERVEDVCRYFPILAERKKQKANTLSGGEQRMLELGRAMMLRPKMMMLDEPSAMLSPKMVATTLNHVKKICETGVGILMVEQNVRAALEIADSVYVLDRGQNKFEGSSEEFLSTDKLVNLYLGA